MLFLLSKGVGFGLRAETWLVLLICLGLSLWRRHPRLARRAFGAALALTVALSALPLGDFLLLPLERRFERPDLPARVDGIVVLGGGEDADRAEDWGVPATNAAAERLIETAALARRYPDATVLVTGGRSSVFEPGPDGGSGPDGSGGDGAGGVAAAGRGAGSGAARIPGASVMVDVLVALGVARDRIVVESQARNTVENVRLSRRLFSPDGQTWILVTSAFHMPRSVGVFRAEGWPVLPWPVDYRTGNGALRPDWDLAKHLRDWNTGAKEWVGLVSYRLLGRTDALFPGPRWAAEDGAWN